MACRMPMKFEPFGETVGVSAMRVNVTIATTTIAMTEMGSTRFP